jgi:hypothetical protein
MKIFAQAALRDFLEGYFYQLKEEIGKEDKNKLLNTNEEEYIDYLVSQYTVEPIILAWDNVHVSDREEMMDAERFPHEFFVSAGERYKKQVISYHIPFTGLPRLLTLAPSTRLMWTAEISISGNTISFDIINWRDDPELIKREAESMINNIKSQLQNVTVEVQQYNTALRQKIEMEFRARKAQHLKQANLLGSLGVPFKKTANVPDTFAIPTVKKKPIIEKPVSSTSPFKPEPALNESVYFDILKICHDAGVEIERHPAIYKGKDEETLRDHFLMVLSPHFESTTGETFNNAGKTDILIRHEGTNVFVAECKFWKGKKAHFQTIDQLLNYLTWRDSKSAILYFIQNQQLDPVLEEIEKSITEHPCFVKDKGKQMQGWFNYRFHLSKDETRVVELAIICFHYPK